MKTPADSSAISLKSLLRTYLPFLFDLLVVLACCGTFLLGNWLGVVELLRRVSIQ